MKQVGLGVDIVDVARLESVISRTPNFVSFSYTENEIKYCNSRGNAIVHFATHFAAKEAVLKSLGTGFLHGIGPKDVEVGHNNSGKPFIILHNNAKKYAEDICDIPISLTYTHVEACAVAVALKDEHAKKEESEDITKKLMNEFKQAKRMLEDV